MKSGNTRSQKSPEHRKWSGIGSESEPEIGYQKLDQNQIQTSETKIKFGIWEMNSELDSEIKMKPEPDSQIKNKTRTRFRNHKNKTRTRFRNHKNKTRTRFRNQK